MNIGRHIERGYEFVYEAEVITNVGTFIETRKLFIPQDDFKTALGISNRIVSDAEMDEGCSNAKPISLAPKTRPREEES